MNNAVLLLAALTSGGLLLWPALRNAGGGAHAVSVTEAVRLINREKGVLLHLGSADEYAKGHAVGARHLPDNAVDKPPAGVLPSNKTLPVLVMCAQGRRASAAVATLRQAGHTQALAVQGGLQAWRDAQLPTESAA